MTLLDLGNGRHCNAACSTAKNILHGCIAALPTISFGINCEMPVCAPVALQLVTVLGHDAACGQSALPESCCMLVTIIAAKRCHCRMDMPKQVFSLACSFLQLHAWLWQPRSIPLLHQ